MKIYIFTNMYMYYEKKYLGLQDSTDAHWFNHKMQFLNFFLDLLL